MVKLFFGLTAMKKDKHGVGLKFLDSNNDYILKMKNFLFKYLACDYGKTIIRLNRETLAETQAVMKGFELNESYLGKIVYWNIKNFYLNEWLQMQKNCF